MTAQAQTRNNEPSAPPIRPQRTSPNPVELQHALANCVRDARLIPTPLPGTPIALWLIDPANMLRPFDAEERKRILDAPPYWCFCWASGLAMARWLAAHPEQVRGKRVLDFGAGSGVAGIAAALAGAAQVVACDIDPIALASCRANAELNGVTMAESTDLFSEADQSYGLVLAADVLYDRCNLPLLDELLKKAPHVLVADSRVRNFQRSGYTKLDTVQTCTLPDLGEPDEFSWVSFYQGRHIAT